MLNTPIPLSQRVRSNTGVFGELDAQTVLEWIEVPAVAVARNGSVVFSNWAFADMIGFTPEMVRVLGFRQIFDGAAEVECPMAVIRAHEHLVVELLHLDGSTVRAKVSTALILGDDEVAIATFDDLAEDPWRWEP